MNENICPIIVNIFTTGCNRCSLQTQIRSQSYYNIFISFSFTYSRILRIPDILHAIRVVAAVSNVDRIDRGNSTSKLTDRLVQ